MTTTMTASDTDRFVDVFEAFEQALPASHPESLRNKRRQAIERFSDLGFPTLRQEEWRFTNVGPIARTPFSLDVAVDGVTADSIRPFSYEGTAQLTLVNGRFVPQLSDLDDLPEGMVVCSLAEALEKHPEKVEPHLGRLASFENHAFVALNTAFYGDGVLIWVPRNQVVEKPINLVLVGSPSAEPIAFFPRNLIVGGESSQVTVVEQYVTVGEGSYG